MVIVAVVCVALLVGACVFGMYVSNLRAVYTARILKLRVNQQELEKSAAKLARDVVLRQGRVDTLAGEVEHLERIRREEREAALMADAPRRTVMDVLQNNGTITAEDVLRARTYLASGRGEQTEEQALIILGIITEADVEAAARELE